MPPETPIEDLVIDIPGDGIAIAGAVGDDGIPKVVPAEGAPEPKEEPKAPAPKFTDSDFESARRELKEAQDRIAQLRAEIDQEKGARGKIEDEAIEDRARAWRQSWARINAEKRELDGHVTALTTAKEAAKRDIIAAKEAGDAAREVEAQSNLAEASAALSTLEAAAREKDLEIRQAKDPYERFEQAYAQRRQTPREEPKPEPERKAEPQQRLTPDEWIETQAPRATRAWFREHPEFVKPGSKEQRKLDVFVAKYLLDNDRDPHDTAFLNTSAFVQALDKEFFPSTEVSMSENERPARKAAAEEPAARPRAPVAAPVSRSGEYYSSANPNATKVKLPPKLAAFVKASGLDATQYALGAIQDIKEGKLPKNFLDPDYDHNF